MSRTRSRRLETGGFIHNAVHARITLSQRLSDILRRARLNRGWTQRQAAECCDLSLATWQNLERSASDPSTFQDLTLARAARGLQIPMRHVFEAAGRPVPEYAGSPLDEPGDPTSRDRLGDPNEMVAHVVDVLERLHAASDSDFLLVCSLAIESGERLLEIRREDDNADEHDQRGVPASS